MDPKKILLELKKILASITGNEDWKRSIEEHLTALEKAVDESDKPTVAHKTDQTAKDNTEALQREILEIKELLTQQEKRAKAMEDFLKEREKAEWQKKLEDYKKKIVEEGKVTPADLKEKWEVLLNDATTFEATRKILDSLPAHPATKDKKDAQKELKVGIMKSASPKILEKVLEYTQTSNNN